MGYHKEEKIVVVGAGPVGALAALYAARRGYDVEVYELRSDLRLDNTTPLNFTKSINLALSERGVKSLRAADCSGLLDSILADTIPMHGRMIHGRKGDDVFQESQKYDAHGRYIRAADRAGLNKRLLDELERMPNVQLFFDHKLTGADFKRKTAWVERKSPESSENKSQHDPGSLRPKEVEIKFDLMIGADGAHSAVRHHLMKYARMSYQQDYIDTLWCEFHIAPTPSGDFAIDANHLHIWPSPTGEFMFIAIPSTNKSFTCTLFMPAKHFDTMDADAENDAPIISFFETNFPGITPNLIPTADLTTQYRRNPHLPLISIKCSPHTYDSSAVILGDAAHAMVPFYGQGMNAGLEDVRVLFEIIDAHSTSSATTPSISHPAAAEKTQSVDLAGALEAYTKMRTPDAHAINDLAMGNYAEMRSSVRSPLYLLRKHVEEFLSVHVPRLGFATQYARVSFGNERYSDVVRNVGKQGEMLQWAGVGTAVAVLAGVAGVGWRAWMRQR